MKMLGVKRIGIVVCCLAACLLFFGCGEKEPEQSGNLVFSEMTVSASSRTGFFGGKHAVIEISGSVTNDTGNPVNNDNLPSIVLDDESATSIKGRMSEKKLLNRETCNVTYEGELDIQDGALPSVSFEGSIPYSGLDDLQTELNTQLQAVVDEYAAEEEAAQKEREAKEREAEEKEKAKAEERLKEEQAKAEEESKKAEAKKQMEDVVGKSVKEAIDQAELLGFTYTCKDADGDNVTAYADDEAFGYFAQDALVGEVSIVEGVLDDAKVTIVADGSYVLNTSNCPELADVLAVANPGDPLVEAFASKYAGRKIEFDGCVAYMAPHENKNKYFDFLLSPGDYDPDSAIGPVFKYKDKSYYDFHFEGEAPDSVQLGMNLHFVARIDEYNPMSELFFVDPVRTTVR